MRVKKYTPKPAPQITNRTTVFGAVVHLLAEATTGAEYSVDVDEKTGTTVYTLRLPLWATISAQSAKSLAKLPDLAARHETDKDALYVIHRYYLPPVSEN